LSVSSLAGDLSGTGSARSVLRADAVPISNSSYDWSNMNPTGAPSTNLYNLAFVYDSDADRIVAYGGHSGLDFLSNQTWWYDFDSQSGVTILFGGHTIDNKYSDDTWAYAAAANSWTDMAPDVRPVGRRSPGMVYDARADRVILFGGFDGTYGLNDTWAYDFES